MTTCFGPVSGVPVLRALAALVLLAAPLGAGCRASGPSSSGPSSSGVLHLSGSEDAVPILRHLSVLVDREGTLRTPDDLEGRAFVPIGDGTTLQPVWLRLEVEVAGPGSWSLSVAPPYERGVLFERIDGAWVGAPVPDYDGPLALPLSLVPGRQTLYLRLAGLSTVPPILQIATARGHEAAQARLLLTQGLYLGAVLLTILLNLTVVRLRERAHLYYVLFVAFTAAFFFFRMGLFSRFVAPSLDRTDLFRPEVLCLVLSAAAATQFSREFLATARFTPRLDLALRAYLGLVLCVSVAVVVHPASYSVASIVGLTLPFVAIGAGIAAHRGGSRWALPYLAAWSFYALGVLLLAFTPPVPAGWDATTFYQLGSAIEIVLLSRALVLRLRVLRDERRHAEERAARAERLAVIGQLATGVVHEVNNPNNLVTFNLPILRDYLAEVAPLVRDAQREDPERRFFGLTADAFLDDVTAMIAQMLHGSERITGIVAGLKSYVGVGRPVDAWEPGDLNEVVSRAVAAITRTAELEPKDVSLELARDLPRLPMASGRIEQIVVNLLDNAVRATDGQSQRRIEVRTFRDAGSVCVEVVDDGHGIPEAIRGRVLEPFFTTRPGAQGVGLGLAISDEIARDHGGGIEVGVDPRGRTRFVVRLSTHHEGVS